jgi:MFS family permease
MQNSKKRTANRLLVLFPALEEKNYQYYFIGQLVSQIGTWLQIVAQGWLVLTLTKSPLLIGLVGATLTLPSLLLSSFGGVIVDRFDKKKLIIATNSGSMILAFILGILSLSGQIQIWHIMILSFLLGTINAVDQPARQAFVSELVTDEKVHSAIALNASIFNAARVVGPGVADN